MRDKISTVFMASLLCMVVPLASYAQTFKITTSVPATSPSSIATKHWSDAITKGTNGRITFQYFWGGSLTKAGEELDAVQRGVANVGSYAVGYYPSKMVLNGISYAVPFNPADPRILQKMADRLVSEVPEIADEFEKYNQKFLFHIIFASYELLANKPVKTLADMKGLKIAVIGASLPKWIEAAGAVPVAMPAPDRYHSLQTKLIDGSVLSIQSSDVFKWHEQAKNCTIINMGALIVSAATMNLNDWKKLSPADQKVFMQAAKDTPQWHVARLAEDESATLKKWKGSGVTINTFSDNDRRTWAESLKHVPYDWAAEWDKKGYAATKALDAYLKAAEEVGYRYPVKFMKR